MSGSQMLQLLSGSLTPCKAIKEPVVMELST